MFGFFLMQTDKNKIDVDFNKLCEETYENLKVKIYAKTGDKNITDEVVQETYRIASENKEKLLSHEQPEGWLYLTAINVYNNYKRKKQKIEHNEVELSKKLIDEFEIDKYSYDITEKIFSILSKKDRELLEMKFDKRFSLKEIAKKRNVSYDSLQRYYHRIIKKIKNIFLEK